MYAVVFWLTNEDGSIKIFNTLAEAETVADAYTDNDHEARVIGFEEVCE